jgi:serine/threonine protein phosphatase PrpC
MDIQYTVVSAADRPGHENEDAVVVRPVGADLIVVVADGHGDRGVEGNDQAVFARFVAGHIAHVLQRPEEEVPAGFDETARRVVERGFDPRVGCVVAGIRVSPEHGKIFVAHAGDVRLYVNVRRPRQPLDRRPGFRVLTRDHTPGRSTEDERLRPFVQAGQIKIRESSPLGIGWMMGTSCLSIPGEEGSYILLEPSRGFGDVAFQPAFTHTPELTTVSLEGALKSAVFALCSDGARRNVGRTFKKFETLGVPDTLAALGEEFLALHAGRVHGLSSIGEDDATVVFFRVVW